MTEQPQPQQEAAFFTAIRQWGLTRGPHGVVGGVVEGLGARVGMAAVPARLIVVLAWILLPGLVMLAYAAAWGLLPDRHGNIITQNFGRGVTNVGALLGIAVLTLGGFVGLDGGPLIDLFGWGAGPWTWAGDAGGIFGAGEVARAFAMLLGVTIPLLVIAGIVVLIVWLVKRSKDGAGAAGGPGTAGTAHAPVEPDAPAAPRPSSAPHSTQDGGGKTDATTKTDAQPNERARASAADHTATHMPQPWEPALLPGDPRLAGAAAASATAPPPPPRAPAPGAYAPPPYVPAVPMPYLPPRLYVPGPGTGGYLALLGILLVSAAIVIGLERADRLAVNPVLAWGAAVTVGLGALLIAVALTGRRLGFLGFLSVLAVLAAVLLAANAADIRTEFDREWVRWDAEVNIREDVAEAPSAPEPTPEHTPTDVTAELASLYSSTFAAGACVSPSWAQPWNEVGLSGESVATMRLDSVGSDLTLDLTAAATRVAVPEGTSIEILAAGATTVVWESRDLSCESWTEPERDEFGEPITGERVPVLTLTNPDEPVLTLRTTTDSTIYLQEVAR
ncbi:MAG: PspC domain-containing protein [Demequina sp.]